MMLVDMTVTFPEMMGRDEGKIVIETAPFETNPHNVLTFLEIVEKWEGGAFFRNAGHVLQAQNSHEGSLPRSRILTDHVWHACSWPSWPRDPGIPGVFTRVSA